MSSSGAKRFDSDDIKRFGVTGNGVSDDSDAIQSALNAGGVVNFTRGNYKITREMVVPGNASVVVPTGSRVFAGTTINGALFRTADNFVRSISFSGSGNLDCADLADIGIHLYSFARVGIKDLTITNAQINGIKLGAAAVGRSAEANIDGVHIIRLGSPIPVSNNYGVFMENSGDHSVSNTVIQSYRIGAYVTSGTSRFDDVHVWGDPALGVHDTSFEDNGGGNVFDGCYADTPASYGFRLRQFNTRVDNCVVYLNPAYSNDNIVRGVKFEQTNPFATVTNTQFAGGDASHRMAIDVEVNGGDKTSLNMSGNIGSNVTTTNSQAQSRTYTTRDLIVSDKLALPGASASLRGQINTVRGGAGVADVLYVCRKNAADAYEWQVL